MSALPAQAPQAPRRCACGGIIGADGQCDKCRAGRHAGSTSGCLNAAAPATVHNVLSSPGRPLDSEARSFMEPRFGRDFGGVRVHDDAPAASSAALMGARAYTVGQHVVFGSGEFARDREAGRRLLAHELAHVVQQDALGPALMRKALPFDSTIELHHRVLKGQTEFEVKNGTIAVTADARWHFDDENDTEQEDTGPRMLSAEQVCGTPTFEVTVSQEGKIWDSDYGSCTFPSNRPAKAIWDKLPEDTYYLTIWTGDHNPSCVLVGEIRVEEISGVSGPTCTQLPPGPIEILHEALNLAGLVPGFGVIPDAVNAGIYAIQGDWKGAGISIATAIPFLGDGFQVGRVGEKLVIKAAGKDVERVGAKQIAHALDEAKAATKAAETEAKTLEKEAAHATSEGARTAGTAARTVEEASADVERDLIAERSKVAEKRAGMSKRQWAKSRAGATKRLYNLLEQRAVLKRMKIFPGRTYLEQAEIVGVSSGGKVTRTAAISKAEKGRIADILELDGSKATLEDLKSPSTQIKSVKGGMSSPEVEAEFRSTSEIAKQHKIEQEVIAEARRTNGKIVVTGRDPLTGAERTIELDPNQVSSKVTDYNDIGGN